MTCDKCAGLVVIIPLEHLGEYECKCLLCSKRFYPQEFEPVDSNPLHRWQSVLCERQCGRKAQRGRERCVECASNGSSHSAKIKAGMREKREREAVV